MRKVVVTLPDDVFHAAEKARLESRVKLTRSQFFTVAMNEFLGRQPEREKGLELQEKFFAQEKDGDLEEWVTQASCTALAEIPWEEEPEP